MQWSRYTMQRKSSSKINMLACGTIQADGSYAGFDESEATSRSGGKYSAARSIKVRPEIFEKLWALDCLGCTLEIQSILSVPLSGAVRSVVLLPAPPDAG